MDVLRHTQDKVVRRYVISRGLSLDARFTKLMRY